MSILAALLALATALIPLVVYFARRRGSPTLEERRDDRDQAFARVEQQIADAETRFDFAAADALRQQLRDRIAPIPLDPAGAGQPDGERLPPAAANRDTYRIP